MIQTHYIPTKRDKGVIYMDQQFENIQILHIIFRLNITISCLIIIFIKL